MKSNYPFLQNINFIYYEFVISLHEYYKSLGVNIIGLGCPWSTKKADLISLFVFMEKLSIHKVYHFLYRIYL